MSKTMPHTYNYVLVPLYSTVSPETPCRKTDYTKQPFGKRYKYIVLLYYIQTHINPERLYHTNYTFGFDIIIYFFKNNTRSNDAF